MPDELLHVTQIRSPIGRPAYQRKTLIALGLNKIGRAKTVAATPANLGRIEKVKHLLRVESGEAGDGK